MRLVFSIFSFAVFVPSILNADPASFVVPLAECQKVNDQWEWVGEGAPQVRTDTYEFILSIPMHSQARNIEVKEIHDHASYSMEDGRFGESDWSIAISETFCFEYSIVVEDADGRFFCGSIWDGFHCQGVQTGNGGNRPEQLVQEIKSPTSAPAEDSTPSCGVVKSSPSPLAGLFALLIISLFQIRSRNRRAYKFSKPPF